MSSSSTNRGGAVTQIQAQSSLTHRVLILGAVAIGLPLALLAAGIASGTGSNSLALLFVAAPAALFAALFITQRFDLAVLLLPVAALAIPLDLPTGTYSRIPAALILTLALCGIWIASALIRRRLAIAPSRINQPALVFSVLCCISLGWGIAWRDPILDPRVLGNFLVVQVASLLTFLASLGAALLVGNFVKTPLRLKIMVGMFITCGLLMTITELLNIHQGFLNDRGLWGLWTVAPTYGLLIAQPNLRWYWRAGLLAVIVLTLYQTMVINADWISGWVPSIIAVLAVTFIHSKKAFLILLLIGAIAAYGARDFFIKVSDDNVNDGSLQRLSLWEQNWRVVQAHWIFGTGPAGYAPYYMTYYRDDARSTHNNYMDILAQFGFTGMFAWLWLALAGVIEGWRQIRRAPPGFLRTLAITATSGWIGAQGAMFFGDWVLPFAYNQTITGYKYTVYSWLFLGTLISIRQILDLSISQAVSSEV